MKNIDEILNKYFDAETSIEEERCLHQYFGSNTISEEHKKYTPIFQHLSASKDKRIIVPIKKHRRQLALWLSGAACAAILVGVLVFSFEGQIKGNQSVVYVDGKKILDINIISSEALTSLMNMDETVDNAIMESQIDILDSFIE